MSTGRLELQVDEGSIRRLTAALRAEADGKELRRELAKNMRDALRPAAAQAKSAIMTMPSAGSNNARPALRQQIAKKIRPEVKLGGMWTGARVKARKTFNVRNFPNAPRRTNSAKGWRTRNFGTDNWRTQYGEPKWFDDSMTRDRALYKEAVRQAMQDMADRIADRAGH
ncbi:hypothetical protein [Streptomyces sp. NBC_00525]|uniref:hypothetical protein n=1 Tax=Streptomyces sp. NBC_00525 TaxID=2903660 RepID=UPI002E81329D|nr:hypothetical protein [Streptomyces sp. NBC_00525]WUC97418.1 hypothetical protein OG710_29060 [Streptomyces sp. NBC_00525]